MPEAVSPQAELPIAPQTPPAPRRFEIPAEETLAPPVETPAASVAPKEPVAQNSGEAEATPAVPEGEKPEEVTPEQAAKREGRRFERKLDKAYRQRAEAQARAELLEKQLDEFRTKAQPQVAAAEGAPKLEQFDYDPEKYAAAVAEHAKSQAVKEFEAKQRTEAGKEATRKLTAAWQEKVDKAEDKYEDWAEKVGDLQPNSPFVVALMEAENGEDVAYHLASHPKEAQRIAQLSPLSQAREIGKLEAKLLSKPVEPKAPSKAPAPITPLTGAASGPADQPSENDDMKAWIRKRQKQVHGVK